MRKIVTISLVLGLTSTLMAKPNIPNTEMKARIAEMAGKKGMIKEFERWPHYKKLYLKAFDNMLIERKKRGLETNWKSAEEVMNWWIYKQ